MEQEKGPSDQSRKFRGQVVRKRHGVPTNIPVVVQSAFTETGVPTISLQATTVKKRLKTATSNRTRIARSNLKSSRPQYISRGQKTKSSNR